MKEILLIFQDSDLRSKVSRVLDDAGFKYKTAQTPTEGLRRFQQDRLNVILTQEEIGGQPVEELIRQVKGIAVESVLIPFLKNPSMNRALELMKTGAYDCMEPSFRPGELLGVIRAALERSVPHMPRMEVKLRPFWKKPRVWVAFSAGLLFLAGSAVFYMHWLSRQEEEYRLARIRSSSMVTLPYNHPSGIVYDGESFWVCDWFSQSIYQHARDERFSLLSVHHFSDMSPIAIAWSGAILWAVSTDGRIMKYSLDGKLSLLHSVRAPGPQPSGVAHDGNYLWTADLSRKKIYKHLPDAKLTVAGAYHYPGESPVGLFWDGAFLWGVDGASKALIRLRLDGQRLLADQVRRFPEYRKEGFKLVGATSDGSRFWSIAEGPARVIRHRLEVRSPLEVAE